jgi:hypothetical protein
VNPPSRPIARDSVPEVATELVAWYSTMLKMLASAFALVVALIVFELVSGFGPDGADVPSLYGAMLGALLTTMFAERVHARLQSAKRGLALACDPSVSWYLLGKQLVATDAKGTRRATGALTLTRRLRAELLSVPRATVVSRPG